MESQKKTRSAGLKKALAVVLMGTVCLTAAVSVGSLSKTVTVTDGTEKVTINTINPDTEAVLAKTGIELGKKDKIVRTGNDIVVMRGVDVESSDGTKAAAEASMADSVLAAGMTFSEGTNISLAAAMENSGAETEIKLARYEITIDLRGETMTKNVPAGTIADALEFLGIELGINDVIDVDTTKNVEEGLKIKITNVEYKTVTDIQTVDYKTIYKDTDELYTGETEVQTAGAEGQRTIVTKEKYVNGKLDSTEKISDKVTKKAVDQVILQGTKEKVNRFETNVGSISVNETTHTLTDTAGREVSYSHVLSGPATAYYAPAGAGTATGRLARYGVVAVDPNEIPYGSILYIVADGYVYGYAVAGDTGGFIYYTDVLVDLFFPTYDECCNFGLRNVSVYVLEGVSEDMTY